MKNGPIIGELNVESSLRSKDCLHIITLNVPFPPDYGGMIDSYYRIKALHHLGIAVILHCFAYGRKPSPELESLCQKVYYYPRHSGFLYQLSRLPYIVRSRTHHDLLNNLSGSTCPILFDGLHTTYLLQHVLLKNRIKLVRAHNIEHLYYETLARLEKNPLRKLYFLLESYRLKLYEPICQQAAQILTVSPGDQAYFQNKFHHAKYIPSFHPFDQVMSLPGKGNYIIFHGDLSVNENVQISIWLIQKIFRHLPYSCIIAGKTPPNSLIKIVASCQNVSLVADPSQKKMHELVQNAHINLMIAFKNNGLKLKLLYSLYAGRHCLVNPLIAEDNALAAVCSMAVHPNEFIEKIESLMQEPFTQEMIQFRQKMLQESFDNGRNAQKLLHAVFEKDATDAVS